MTSHYVWSVIPADNATADSNINWQELQDPDTVNNSARQMMARGAEWRIDMSDVRVSTGVAANTYEITIQSTPTALTNGMLFTFRAHQNNTGASTLKVNAFAAKELQSISGTALGVNSILAGQIVLAFYDAANDRFLMPYSNGAQAGGDVNFANVNVGVDDTTTGTLTVYGGNNGDEGGTVRIHNAADHDGVVEWWDLIPNAIGGFSIKRSNSATADLAVESDGSIKISNVSGTARIGPSNQLASVIAISGGAIGATQGGQIVLEKPADFQDNGTFWLIDSRQENFRIETNSAPFFEINQLGNITFPAYGAGTLQTDANGVVTAGPAEPGIGVGQTWASSTVPGANVPVQNTTGRSIMVYVRDRNSQSVDRRLEVSPNGSTGWVECGIIGREINTAGGSDNHSDSCTAIVPPGHYWRTSATTDYVAILQ